MVDTNNASELMKKALTELRELRSRLKTLEAEKSEPIAVLGMGCRFPGAIDSPETFWNLLHEGAHAITEVPRERWNMDALYDADPEAPGKIYARHGAFLDDIEHFDPAFFGISPKEAACLDPKQRLLLEVSWEALENAHQTGDLQGKAGGVFIGIGNFDFPAQYLANRDISQVDAYFATGSSLCVAAGRLSYFLGLVGPSMAVDTACSASLVVVQLAVESLRRKECDLALAGGVNLMLAPEISVNFCRARMLSVDGRCKTFDAAANGYVRGEGCGIIVLKRLSDARAANDPIMALIRGAAVNQDGASGGLTVPNGPSQERVIRKALANGGVLAEQVGYIEAHGTGTALGDPIEMGALGNVFAKREEPLVVGSVKTNIGHLESAAGIAGLMKVVLSMQKGEIPASLHFQEPNPKIDWARLPIRVAAAREAWDNAKPTLFAGVSSFGFSGTNAHVVLQNYSAPAAALASQVEARPLHLLALSAKSPEALKRLAESYARELVNDPLISAADFCFTANTRRAHFSERLAVIGADSTQLRDILLDEKRWYKGHFSEPPSLVFLFTGQGSQFAGVGRVLYESQPVFRRTLDQCFDILGRILGTSLREVLFASDSQLLDETRYTQPLLFALEYSLAEMWKSWGVRPTAVIGHSVGEYVAACCAGVFSLEEGLMLVAERGRLMQSLPQNGAMLAVSLGVDQLRELLGPYGHNVSIAAINSPESVVLSGEKESLASLEHVLREKNIRVQNLRVSHAFHSQLMEPIMDQFREIVSKVTLSEPRIYLVSNITGKLAGPEMLNPSYWVNHIRASVAFADGLETLYQEGYRIFLEMGPKPVLSGMGRQCLPEDGVTWLPALRPEREWQQTLATLGECYTRGVPVNWRAFDQGQERSAVALPTYPFEKQRYALDSTSRLLGKPRGGHPLLGVRRSSALGDTLFDSQPSAEDPSWLVDHCILGKVVLPAAAFLEMALAAGVQVCKSDALVVEDFLIHQPLILGENRPATLQTIVAEDRNGTRGVRIFGLDTRTNGNEEQWICHASGLLTMATTLEIPDPIEPERIEAESEREISQADYYRQLDNLGLNYGLMFQVIRKVLPAGDCVYARLDLPVTVAADIQRAAYRLHPVLLDACFQAVAATLPNNDEILLPVAIGRLEVFAAIHKPTWCRAELTSQPGSSLETVTASVVLFDEGGRPLARVLGLIGKRSTRDSLFRSLAQKPDPFLYRLSWEAQCEEPVANEAEREPGSWLIFCDRQGPGAELAQRLLAQGEKAETIYADLCREASNGIGEASLEDLLGSSLRKNAAVTGVLFMCEGGTAEPDRRAEDLVFYAFSLVRALLRVFDSKLPQLWFVTRGAQQVNGEALRIEQAPLWGFAHSLAWEHPELGCRCIDLDPCAEAGTESLLELLTCGTENRMAVRAGIVHVARLLSCDSRPDQAGPIQLQTTRPGALENLVLAPMDRLPPGRGMVEVEVCAAGLNFRDVLRALGMLKVDPSTLSSIYGQPSSVELPFGIECSGRIAALGEKVQGLAVGDEVVAVLAPGSLGSYVTVCADFVQPKPKALSFEEAATLPLTFLTAWYGLVHLAKIKCGDRILIHAAAGGVGMAAIQIAQGLGAEVFASASPPKWSVLRGMGVTHIMNSRTLDFAEVIKEKTLGKGVDIVLNSLNGDFIPKSIGVCAVGARFVEIGKLGIWEPEKIAQTRPDLAYFPFDLGEIGAESPELIGRLFADVLKSFDDGMLRPLHHRVFPLSNAVDAFRHMAQGRHLGKIVLAVQAPEAAVKPAKDISEGTWLITGGFGALGRASARFLVAEGVQHLVLTGRNPEKAENQAFVKELSDLGVSVIPMAADAAVRQQAVDLLARIAHAAPPLKGVVHMAGILEDGVIEGMEWEQCARVLAPKIKGAWNLHDLTQDLNLSYFVMYSSIVSVLGNGGQTAYAGANAFMDGLAQHRRGLGLPALSINWGPWAGAGMAEALHSRDRRGIRALDTEINLSTLKHLLEQDHCQTLVLDMDWPAYLGRHRHGPNANLVSHLVAPEAQEATVQTRVNWLPEELKGLDASQRPARLTQHLQAIVGEVLGQSETAVIALDKPLADQGFDSLMAVELRNLLNQATGISLPVGLLFDYPTLEKIAFHLLDRLDLQGATQTKGSAMESSAEDVLGEIDRLLAEI